MFPDNSMVSFQCPGLCNNHFIRRLSSSFKECLKEKKKKKTNGWTGNPFFPGDTHLELRGGGFVRAPTPPSPPPLLPQRPLLQGSQGHLLLRRKRGYCERYHSARSASSAVPRGGGRRRCLWQVCFVAGSRGRPQRPRGPRGFCPGRRSALSAGT